MEFDTKIKVILREGLESWQELNVTAFLMCGMGGANPAIKGETYEDADGVTYGPLSQQPIVVLTASPEKIREIVKKAKSRDMEVGIFTMGMFDTFNDEDNRAEVRSHRTDELDLAGVAIRGSRNYLDRITKGLQMHK